MCEEGYWCNECKILVSEDWQRRYKYQWSRALLALWYQRLFVGEVKRLMVGTGIICLFFRFSLNGCGFVQNHRPQKWRKYKVDRLGQGNIEEVWSWL